MASVTPSSSIEDLKKNPEMKMVDDEPFIPSYIMTFFYFATGKWLSVNDGVEEGAKDQMMGENVNISLICALLFTTFIPLYYVEPARMEIPDDGLTLQIYNGLIHSWQEIQITSADIHDWFDTFYIIASAGACFGTLVSVFYMLGCNECLTDSKVMVMRHYLGVVGIAPFFFFAVGIISWAIGGYLQLVLSPQTYWGFIVKHSTIAILILIVLIVCIPRMVQGVYAANLEEKTNPPMILSNTDIENQIDIFLADDSNRDLSLRQCLSTLHPVGKSRYTLKNYKIPLHTVTELIAKKLYVEKMALKSRMSIEDVKFYLKLDKTSMDC